MKRREFITLRRRPSIPLFWRGPQHNIGDRHYSPSVAGLIVREITALSHKYA